MQKYGPIGAEGSRPNEPHHLLKGAVGLGVGTGIAFAARSGLAYPIQLRENQLDYMRAAFRPLAKRSRADWIDLVGGQRMGAGKVSVPASMYALDKIKMFEEFLFKIPRTFDIWSMGFEFLTARPAQASYIKLTLDSAHISRFGDYYKKVLGRELTEMELQRGFEVAPYLDKGRGSLALYRAGETAGEPVLKEVSLIPRFWEMEAEGALPGREHITRYGQAAQRAEGARPVGRIATDPFIVSGSTGKMKLTGELADLFGEKEINIGPRLHSALKRTGRISHTLSTRYFSMLDDPFEAINQVLFAGDARFLSRASEKGWYRDIFRGKFGTGFEYGGNVVDLWARHAKKMVPLTLGLYAGYKVLESVSRTVTDKSPVQLLATPVANVQRYYTGTTETLGLNALARFQEKEAPGSSSPLALLGASLAAGFTAMAGEGLYDAAKHGFKFDSDWWMRRNVPAQLPRKLEFLGETPGIRKLFSGDMGKAGIAFKAGALLGAALMIPFIPGMLGTTKSPRELEEEMAGIREVPVRKGRAWEMGRSSFSGENVTRYEPNWFRRIMDEYTGKSLWGDLYDKPLTRMWKDLVTPHWWEKENYEERPSPFTVGQTSAFGPLGSLWNITLAPLLKPPAFMHGFSEEDQMMESIPGKAMGEGVLPPSQAITPIDPRYQTGELLDRLTTAIGLPGFVISAIKGKVTGREDFATSHPVLANADLTTSIARQYYEMELGGLATASESIRRVIPKPSHLLQTVNPIPNTGQPTWIPGYDYFLNLKTGNPFEQMGGGEYRLPGAGLTARYPELEGIDPEEYPDVWKHRILADVAPYSKEYQTYKQKVESQYGAGELTSEQENLYRATEWELGQKQLDRDFAPTAPGIMGSYYGKVRDTLRMMPIEHLLPISPAHKFMGPSTPEQTFMEYEVLSTEHPDWASPIESFVKPALNVTLHSLGVDRIPDETKERRQINSMFDRLSYEKNSMLADESKQRGEFGASQYYSGVAQKTFAASNLWASPDKVNFVFDRKDRTYYKAFMSMPEEARRSMLQNVPDYQKAYYLAGHQRARVMNAVDFNPTYASKDQVPFARQREQVADVHVARRRAKYQVARDPAPALSMPRDWVGYDKNVALKDIKLKMVKNSGFDFHRFNLWEQQDFMLNRKPYINDAAVEPPEDLLYSRNWGLDTLGKSLKNIGADYASIMPGPLQYSPTSRIHIETDRRGKLGEIMDGMGF